MRYWNGAVVLSETDITAPSSGLFSQERVYHNKTVTDYDGPNGYNWFVTQLPYAASSGTSIAIFFDPNNPYWFNLSGSTYLPRYNMVGVNLVEDTSAKTLTFTRTRNGLLEVAVFNSKDATIAPWGFVSYRDYRGTLTQVTSRLGSQINEVQRSYNTTSVVESLQYTYFASGSAAGKIQYVTYSQIGGSTTDVKRVAYAYYGTSDANGGTNDLKTATEQTYNGTGWDDVSVKYYRYYKTTSSTGFPHGLKMHFGREAYRRMLNDGVAIDTATDGTVQPYADHYFEYDSSRRVKKEVSAVCPSCPGGGTTSDTFAYAPRAATPGYNTWAMKTTQTLPDGAKVVVYSNYIGRPMLRVYVDSAGTGMWGTFYRYNASGQVIWQAQPSAVALPTSLTTLEAFNDLLNYNGGTGHYQYLNNSAGVIYVTDYFGTTNIGLGQVQGYISAGKLRQGQTGSDVLLRSYAYTSHTDGSGSTVYPLAALVEYPDAANPATTITTSYSYAWYTGTNQTSQMTVTFPVVPSGQNGSGVAATHVTQYDQDGNVTATTDERGTVDNFTYDPILARVTQQTLNVQSGVTAPGVNVVTDFTYDSSGRLTRSLGPSHTVVHSGVATTVRGATWYVYAPSVRPMSGTWGPDELRLGGGYATGTSPGYTYTLINPVTLMRTDKNGRSTDHIASKRTTGSGALLASDTFTQTDWRTWNSTQYDNQGHTTSRRAYHLIPSSGTGSIATNYGKRDYGYDALERLNRVIAFGGTITRTVWTAPQHVASVWAGTNDTGATDANPAGSGSPNNMVQVQAYQYDGGSAGGDGNLTQVTEYASASDTRVTSYSYDFRDRRTSTDGEVDRYDTYTYDNLGRVTQVDRRNTSGVGNLIARSQAKYDDRGRIYQQIKYAVDPATGTLGNALTENTWFDSAGYRIQQVNQNSSQSFNKWTYNGVGWVTATHRGYNTSGLSYSQALTVTNDTIFSQTERTYGETGNLLCVTSYDRLNDAPATGTGSTGALTSGSNPKARVSYAAWWYDGIDRAIGTAQYGAAGSFTRPSTVPTRADTVLVAETGYDDAGRDWKTTDPLGLENRTAFDAAGRATQTVESYSATAADDTNRTTNFTYTLDGQVATITAVNGRTGNQTTTYTYGTTLAESGVARNDLLRFTDYPDSISGSDRTAVAYNRLGRRLTFTDQRGTVRTFYYDKLGRLTNDCITTNGTGTDVAVKQVATAYDVKGLVTTVSSTDSGTQGSGTVLNQVKLTYNDFGQLTKEEQAHGGSVTTGAPAVQYAYDSGASGSNQVRLNAMTYPNARVITIDYGSAGDPNDRLNRTAAIKDGATALAAYAYLGEAVVVRIDYSTQPQVMLDLWGGTSGTFAGLDRFNRIVDQRWLRYATGGSDLDRYQYGYDRDSNRTWKQNAVGTGLDEFYTYDRLNRLATMDRGTLTGVPPTGISGTPVLEQDWTLDPTGNWRGYVTKASGTTNLDQSRTFNVVNQITAITETTGPSWVDPAYDAVGNTTTFPKPTLTSAFTATYDAWNRMTGVKDGGTDVAKYKYDGHNRRIIQESYTGGTLTETRHVFFTNQWQAVEERVGTATSADKQYVWGVRYIDELICRDDATTQRLYAMQDANYNVTSIIDAAGVVVERYLNEPYGAVAYKTSTWGSRTSSSFSWVYLHHGGRYDSGIGTYHFRRRDYLANVGRWISPDPMLYIDGFNLFEYIASNPPRNTDAFGQMWGCDAARPQRPPTDGECCAKAGSMPFTQGYDGQVICCDGRPVACDFHRPVSNHPANGIIARCVTEHELDHQPWQKPCGSGVGPSQYIDVLNPAESARFQHEAECHALQVTIDCLYRERGNGCPPGDQQCLSQVQQFINHTNALLSANGCWVPETWHYFPRPSGFPR